MWPEGFDYVKARGLNVATFHTNRHNNASFVAASRTIVPILIEEVMRLRDALQTCAEIGESRVAVVALKAIGGRDADR